jgi:hypothetical protein
MALAFFLASCSQNTDKNTRDAIKAAVSQQLQEYPASSLQDIYKSFYQDDFGPGHLLQDTAAAYDYFVYELAGMESLHRYAAEPCGLGGRFVRVPMDIVKDSLVDKKTYFEAFLASTTSFSTPDVEKWKNDWNEIVKVVEGMALDLEGFNEDKMNLEEMLDQGETMVHHSQSYSDAYDPHYRIITKAEYERLIKDVK